MLKRIYDRYKGKKAAEEAAAKAAAAATQKNRDLRRYFSMLKFKNDEAAREETPFQEPTDPGPSEEEIAAKEEAERLKRNEEARRQRSLNMRGGGREGLMYRRAG